MAGKLGAKSELTSPLLEVFLPVCSFKPQPPHVPSSLHCTHKNLPAKSRNRSIDFIAKWVNRNKSLKTAAQKSKNPHRRFRRLSLKEPLNLDLLPLLKVKKLSEKAVVLSRIYIFTSSFYIFHTYCSASETKVPARGKALIPTDLSISIPQGTYARIAPRSGLAWKHSMDVGAGVIDADYRGAVGVILFNHSDVDFQVKCGDRIAQLIIEMIMTPEVLEVEDLDSTKFSQEWMMMVLELYFG